jgi:hypothetical protein
MLITSSFQFFSVRHSTPNHPARRQLSTPPSKISMKFGIQHLWTNITTRIFYFLHIGSRSVFTALWKLLWMLVFFRSRQNSGTTLFASIEHSKAIKGPKDFKFTLFIENFMRISKMWSKIVFNLLVPIKQLLTVKKIIFKRYAHGFTKAPRTFFCQVLG